MSRAIPSVALDNMGTAGPRSSFVVTLVVQLWKCNPSSGRAALMVTVTSKPLLCQEMLPMVNAVNMQHAPGLVYCALFLNAPVP